MRVLYWNCTSPGLGGDSFARAKKTFIGNVVRAMTPDIVCLDEVSAGISDTVSAQTYATNVLNGATISFKPGTVVTNSGVHLNSATWTREGFADAKRTDSGLPSTKWNTDQTKRDLSLVNVSSPPNDTKVWFLHANASPSGGKAAARLADTNADGTRMVFIGDFNCPIADALSTVAPNVAGHNFTQWKRHEHGKATVPNRIPPVKYDPHDIIDYAICDSKKIKVTAVDSVSQFALLDFIVHFDHFPVVYDIV